MNDAQNAARKASGGARATQPRPASEIVSATLAAHPDRTAADLAQLAELGISTVTKALAALERAGRARRRIPEVTGDGGRRAAARWQPIPVVARADVEPSTASPHRPTTKARTSKAPKTSTTATAQTPAAQPSDGRSARRATAADTTADAAHAGRLGKGELGTLVLEYLIARPDADLGPTAIGKALSRSQGAVANCLTKLANSGDIAQTGDKPRRYRLAS